MLEKVILGSLIALTVGVIILFIQVIRLASHVMVMEDLCEAVNSGALEKMADRLREQLHDNDRP